MEQTKRWAQITCWDRPALDLLHRLETIAHGKELAAIKARQRIAGCWELIFPEYAASVAGRFQLSPFWPDSVPTEEQAPRIDAFKRAIYPIWGKIESDWTRKQTGTETSMIHKCDLAIFQSGHKVDRLYLGDIRSIRQKAARAQKYGNQFADAMTE